MAEAKVFIVNDKYDAKYKVYFCDNKNDQKNYQIISPGKLVSNKYDANVKVFIVDNKYDADIMITRENFPK
jgi:capsular polysaccharide biosynthesis protein